MDIPEWLKEEGSRGGGFWRRNYDVAVEMDEACADALLQMLERQLANEDTGTGSGEESYPAAA